MMLSSSPVQTVGGPDESPPLVVHVIHALRVGGLENGLVNLVNNMDQDRYRHSIVCMTEYSDFRYRIKRPDVEVVALHKENLSRGAIVRTLYHFLRTRRPSIVHGRNWDGLDALLPAWLARVPVRIQGEHGWDMHDLDGSNRRLRWLRRLTRPLATHYTTVSRDLADYLETDVGVSRRRISQIYNGVDTLRFQPSERRLARHSPWGSRTCDQFVIGTVGRMVAVKDQIALVRVLARLTSENPVIAKRLRLLIVGDGPLRNAIENEAAMLGVSGQLSLPGATENVAEWFQTMDLFVLPSLAEGISNTVLEAMASGLPVVATDVGGNADLVAEGITGHLVQVGDQEGLCHAILRYVSDSSLCRSHGEAARLRAQSMFSIQAMVDGYTSIYDQLLSGAASSIRATGSDSALGA